jgi:hypothetical protein
VAKPKCEDGNEPGTYAHKNFSKLCIEVKYLLHYILPEPEFLMNLYYHSLGIELTVEPTSTVNLQIRRLLKIFIFWGVMPCGSCKTQRFGGMYCLHQGDKNQQARNNVSSN